MPANPVFATMTLPSGSTYEFKDTVARQLIEDLTGSVSGAVHFVGLTTTPLTDGASTSPIVIEGENYTPKSGDVAIYGTMEFIWNATASKWREFGSTGSLKALAFKDSATGNFTPAGTVSQPSFSGVEGNLSVSGTPTGSVAVTPTVTMDKTDVTPIATVGTLPALQFSVSGENLSITWDPGTLPTKGSDVRVATDVASASATATFTGDAMTSTGKFTPQGVVGQPTFTGAQGSVTVE